MKRRELQPIIDTAVASSLEENKVPSDPEHVYRLCRTYLRLAARAAIASGVHPEILLSDFTLALVDEAEKTQTSTMADDKPVLVINNVVGQA